MKLSARNQFPGVVSQIKEGAVNSIVTIELAVGKEATAVIKATSVMFGVEE